jgi:hypothetical protein
VLVAPAPVPLILRRYTPPPLPRAATATRPPVPLASVAQRLAGGLDPARLSTRAGLVPDDWQAEFLRSTARQVLVLCSRQVGKSETTATLAAHTAIYDPGAPVLLLSPSLRQSGQLFGKVRRRLKRLGTDFADITTDNALSVKLGNGSEIHSLPGKAGTVRGFSGVKLAVVDEAAFVSEDLYSAVSPMLAVSGGRLVLLSTPFGKRGGFYEQCAYHEQCLREGRGSPWELFRVTADDCPRIPEEFKAEERRKLGILYEQEYMTAFLDVVTALFRHEDIARALDNDLEPYAFDDEEVA